MSANEGLKIFFVVLGIIVGLPMLLLTVKAGMFFGSLARTVTSLDVSATAFALRIDKMLEKLSQDVGDHETRIQLAEQFIDATKIEIGWIPGRRVEDPHPAVRKAAP